MVGAALLFWGGMTDRWLIAVPMALLLEAGSWIPLRWEFDTAALTRAWKLTCVLLVAAGTLIWFEGTRVFLMPQLLGWFPALLLPMQFVQVYGLSPRIPAFVFSLFANTRRKRMEEQSPGAEPWSFHFGYVYFAVCLVAACQGSRAGSVFFLPCLLALLAMLFLRISRSNTWIVLGLLLVAGGGARVGQELIDRAEIWFGGRRLNRESSFDPREARTNIGRKGRVNLPRDIIWRLRVEPGQKIPKLLRTASFNQYTRSTWASNYSRKGDFPELETKDLGGKAYYLLQSPDLLTESVKLPRFELRGSASEETPLPLPGDTAVLRDFDLDGIESNVFGLVRVYPKESVINGAVFWNGSTNPERPPLAAVGTTPSEDLQVPAKEKRTLAPLWAELGYGPAARPSAAEAITTLRNFFQQKFEYTLDLDITQRMAKRNEQPLPTPMEQFLTTRRRGHCEYFATAATLMFRQVGIPARYATGFAVAEYDGSRKEFIIRANHGHAWVRVWDAAAERWIDFDPTPPSWQGTIISEETKLQRFNDLVKLLREDFFIWRNQPANRIGVTLVMSTAGLALLLFIFMRLWRSRRRVSRQSVVSTYHGAVVSTPLHKLEAAAERVLGRRPPSMPFARWLAGLRARLRDPEALDEALRLHQRMRFDPAPAMPASTADLGRHAAGLEKEIRTLPAKRRG